MRLRVCVFNSFLRSAAGRVASLIGLALALLSSSNAAPPVVRSTYFDGVVAHAVRYSAQGEFTLNAAPMTIEAWVYRIDATRCEAIVSHGFQDSYWFGFCPRLRFYRSGGFFADADVDVPARQWTHVAASYDGNRVRFYIDGVLSGDKLLAHGTAKVFNTLTLGADFTLLALNANRYVFRGYLDEVRLWNVARTAVEIQSNRFLEPRNLPELMVAFGDAGSETTLLDASPSVDIAAWRTSGFGVLPTRLVVPRAAFPITLDGTIQLDTEYAGAEQMVVRYQDGKTIADSVVYLVYTGSTNFPTLYIGAPTLRYPLTSVGESGVTAYVHNSGSLESSRSELDFAVTVPFSGNASATHYLAGGFNLPIASNINQWREARALCQFEFHPACIEIALGPTLLANGGTHRLLFQNYGVTALSDVRSTPGNGQAGNPSTWAQLTFGDNVDVASRTVQLYLETPFYNSWNTNRRDYDQHLVRDVQIFSGESSLAGVRMDSYIGVTHQWLSAGVRADRNVTYKVLLHPGDEIHNIYWNPRNGTRMIRTNAPGEYVFSLCDGTNGCTLGVLTLQMEPTLGPISLTSISPNKPVPLVTLRETPHKTRGGGTMRIFGTNLHSQLEVYAANCPSNQVLACVGTGEAFPLTIVDRDGGKLWVDVQIPEVARRWWNASTRIWLRDRFRVRDFPGTEWNTPDGAGGLVTFTPPPWPELYGFEFINTGAGTSPEEFEAVYGDSVFTFIPLPPFKVRDPYYYSFWWWVFLGLADASDSGSCHGFAGASQLYYRGLIPLAKYDDALSGGPTGAYFPSGFYGLPVGDHRNPYGPIRWSGFDLFKAFEPRNLWAQIRVYMMAQFSEEALGNTISQARLESALGSDPVEQLGYLGSGTSGHVLCFNPGGIGKGHCVTPYGILSNKGFDPTSSVVIDKPGFSTIKVYDNNWPERESFMEIAPRSSGGRYTFRLGSGTVWSSHSLTRTPISIFTGARHAPGASFIHDPDLLYRLATAQGVRADYSSDTGGRLGFDEAGKFHDEYPGARAVAPVTGFDTNRESSDFFAFLPATNAPTTVRLRTYGARYAFHAGQDQIALQLIASNAIPGAVDRVDFLKKSGALSGFRFRNPLAHTGLTPMLSQTLAGRTRMIFRLDGLKLPPNADFDLVSLPEEQGFRLVNRTGGPLSFALKFDGLKADAGTTQDALFESISLPAGAAGAFTLGDIETSGFLNVEIDLDNDGVVDQVMRSPSEYVLVIRRSGPRALIEWRVRGAEAALETSNALAPASWSTVPGIPARSGTLRSLEVPTPSPDAFFRLKR